MLLVSLDSFHKKLELLRLRLEQVLNFITAVISHTRLPTIFSHFENCVLVDVNQMYS